MSKRQQLKTFLNQKNPLSYKAAVLNMLGSMLVTYLFHNMSLQVQVPTTKQVPVYQIAMISI